MSVTDSPGSFQCWMEPCPGVSPADSRIVKGSGYFDVALLGVTVSPHHWVQCFGDAPEVLITTITTCRTGMEALVSRTIQGTLRRPVDVAARMTVQRPMATQIPAHIDSIRTSIDLSAIDCDGIGDVLNQLVQFQRPLGLSSEAQAQSHLLNCMIEDLLATRTPRRKWRAAWKAMLDDEVAPTTMQTLRRGYVVLLPSGEPPPFDLHEMSVDSQTGVLVFEGQPLATTHLVFKVISRPFRGEDARSLWSRRFHDAAEVLDNGGGRNLLSALHAYQQAIGLLRSDPAYLSVEKQRIENEHTANLLRASIRRVRSPLTTKPEE